MIVLIQYSSKNNQLTATTKDKDCRPVHTPLGTYDLNEDINWSILLNDYTLKVTTDKEKDMTPYVYSWMNTTVPIYFKHGLYV